MPQNGLIDQFLLHMQTINRHLRKGVMPEANHITRLQWMLLRHVHRSENCTMGKIAEKFGVRPSTVSQMADRLEKSGLVERVSGEDDARQKVIRLTEEGKALIHSVQAVWAERLAEGLDQFTPTEQTQLIHLLARLAASLKEPERILPSESNHSCSSKE